MIDNLCKSFTPIQIGKILLYVNKETQKDPLSADAFWNVSQ